jgi:uncharacterized membrane protein
MRQLIVPGLLWFSAIGCGMLAGVYFAFSAFVMTALGRIDQAAGLSAMNAINTVIVQSWFMPLFLGTTLTSLALTGLGIFRWGDPGAAAMLAGGLVYVVGMFVVTAVFNVPLNNALAAAEPGSSAGALLWSRFLNDWTLWNHVRSVASTGALALFIMAIAAR